MSGIDAVLLRALRAAPFYCTSGELAALTSADLHDVETSIAGLRAAGFVIEERPALVTGFCPRRIV